MSPFLFQSPRLVRRRDFLGDEAGGCGGLDGEAGGTLNEILLGEMILAGERVCVNGVVGLMVGPLAGVTGSVGPGITGGGGPGVTGVEGPGVTGGEGPGVMGGAGVRVGIGEAVDDGVGSLRKGVNFLRNFLFRKVALPEPSTLTTY